MTMENPRLVSRFILVLLIAIVIAVVAAIIIHHMNTL
jgi:hypothetical protein